MNWYVLYTKPKWEKRVAEQLNKIGINCYCPIITKIQQWSDRKKKVQVPLFNNYVFVKLEDKDRNYVFQSPGVIRYLYWLGKHAIVKEYEIETIKKYLKSESAFDITVEFNLNHKIKFNSGPFIDQQAIIKEKTNTHYILELESLGCILKMKIPEVEMSTPH